MIRMPLFLVPIFIFLLLSGIRVNAQGILSRTISINAEREKLSSVLNLLEQKGDFRFSYNSSSIRGDSIVSFHSEGLTIEETLNHLLNDQFEYKEAHNFVVLRYAPYKLSLVLRESSGNQEHYIISGRIINTQTRNAVKDASIYEKNLLQSTFSNSEGFFTLRLKNIPGTVALTISKENYKDLTSLFLPEITIRADKEKNSLPSEDYITGDVSEVERTRLGRLFVTSRQKLQSINLGGFIANAPIQASLSPGLSSHGSLSGQVVNKFSLNATGGYSAGVDGVEIGLLFNINKKDVRYFQFGSAFNVTGGNVSGVQIGGLFNYVLDSVNGIQVSLGYNRISGSFEGFQIGGLLNTVRHDFNGVQFTMGYNRISKDFQGFQFGGFHNSVKGRMSGIQLSSGYNKAGYVDRGIQAGLFNSTKELKGLQIGLVNIADTSSGYSIGLLNIIRKGYHKIMFGTNETINLNATVKTGTEKFYTMLLGGMNTGSSGKLYAIGLGFGKEYELTHDLRLNPEISSRYLYQGSWQDVNLLNRLDINLGYKLNKWLTLSGGPALNIYYSEQQKQIGKYAFIPQRRSWIGWNIGLNIL